MASLILTVGGSALGNAILPGIGGALLGSAGAYLGGQIDTALFGETKIKGPRLDTLKVQDSTYGKGIPIVYGNVRVAGNVIWSSDLIETLSSQSVGGKGGGSSASVEHASYSVDCAIAIGMNPLTGAKQSIRTIWADSKIIYENGTWNDGVITDAEFYAGDAAQAPSPVMESYLGVGNVPAYRGMIYVVLHGLQLSNFGNRIPNLTFEIAPDDSVNAPNFISEYNPSISSRPDTMASPNAMPALPIATSGSAITKFLVGGYKQSGTSYQFVAIEMDVSSDTPVEITRTLSTSVTRSGSLNDISWALSRDGETVVFYMLHTDSGTPITLALYNITTRSFGNCVTDNFAFSSAHNQIAWLDDQRFVIQDVVSGECGVRVYAASGLTPVPLGFFGVWGAGSSGTRYTLPFAHYAPLSGGLCCVMADAAFTPNNLYTRTLQWQNNSVVVGAEINLSNTLAGFSSSRAALLPLGDNEFVIARIGSSQTKLLSFTANYSAASVTRNWTSISFSPSGDFSMNVKDGKLCFLHEGATSTLYRYGEIAITATSFTISSTSTIVAGSYFGTKNYFSLYAVDRTRMLLLAMGSSGTFSRIALIERGQNGQGLDVILGDVLSRAGYGGGESDLSALSTILLQGYQLDGPMAARAALEPLQLYGGFDLVESDGILKAKKYSAAIDKTVSTAEARSANENQEQPPVRKVTRAQELDLPREVTINYLDPAQDFQRGSQRARRIASKAQSVENLNLPIVCPAQNAKQLAESQLYRRWAERSLNEAHISRAYLDIDVGDVISLDGETLRITEINHNGGLLKASAVPVADVVLGSNASADAGQGNARHSLSLVDSTMYLMDIPLLRSTDDQPGMYVAISGRSGWRGAALLRSSDGSNFSTLDTFSLPAITGVATSVLSTAPTHYMDRARTVNVALLYGSLSSCSESDLLNGANAALLGDEIIQFQTATLNGDGSYTLSNLLRGRKGTENKTFTHSVGERFIVLQSSTLHFVPLNSSDKGKNYYYRGVSTGQNVQDVGNMAFASGLLLLQPLAPTHLNADRNSSSDITLNWKRRARRDAEWVDLIDVPLDETSELYDIEIMNGANVVRSILNQTTTNITYTAAQQISDFGATQSAVTFKIYQLSSRYGRGAAATATL